MYLEKLSVSIDRITATGTTNKTLQDIYSALGNYWLYLNGSFVLTRTYENGDTENMAYLIQNYQYNSFRVDFNPNNMLDFEREQIRRALSIFNDVHFTRHDIAFDIYNNSNAKNYKLYRWNTTETEIGRDYIEYAGKDKVVETRYWGSRSSERQVRQYDKLREQKKRRKELPKNVDSWIRLELQLRGKKTDEWLEEAYKMLDDWKMPRLDNLSVNDRVALYAIENKVADWQEFAREKRARLRQLITQNDGYDVTLSQQLKQILKENESNLQSELDNYLSEFEIKKS